MGAADTPPSNDGNEGEENDAANNGGAQGGAGWGWMPQHPSDTAAAAGVPQIEVEGVGIVAGHATRAAVQPASAANSGQGGPVASGRQRGSSSGGGGGATGSGGGASSAAAALGGMAVGGSEGSVGGEGRAPVQAGSGGEVDGPQGGTNYYQPD